MSRKSENFAGILQYGGNPNPFLFSVPPPPKKNTGTIWRKFSTEISVQMVSAHYIEEEAPKMDNDVNRLITKNIPHNREPKEKLQKSLN